MVDDTLLRLERVEIETLFGLYDHQIDLNLEDRVTLLHGANGVGKTTALQMVNALLHNNLDYFSRIPFDRFLLRFLDGSVLELKANETDGSDRTGVLTLRARSGSSHQKKITLTPTEAEAIASQVSFLRPYSNMPNAWIDVRDDEILTEADVMLRFGNRVRARTSRQQNDVQWLNDFLERTDAHFIEAQRLVRAPADSRTSKDLRRHRPVSPVASVLECSRDFQTRLRETMASYGRQAQTLDQTFPQRLVAATEELALEELQARLTALDDKTEEFKAIGILDETPAHPFDVTSLRDMDSTQARVMTLYVQDTESKLSALDDLARRARLLLDNVNGKYQHKELRLDQSDGLVAEDENEKPLPLEGLSSGEQHEFVLHYELLFGVRPNTVVLIDEPELSLHVAWQKRFLPELTEIVRLSGFDTVVATHSPFIVNEREDLMVALGGSA